MGRLIFAFYLLGASCAPRNPSQFGYTAGCVTRCGLRSATRCGELQALESRWLYWLPPVLDVSRAAACEALSEWVVMAHHYRVSDAIACPSGKSWPAAFRPTLCLLGYTHENLHLVEVNKAEWLSSTLSHELVHVVELKARGRAGHCRWDPRGVKAALFRVTGSQDDSDSDCTDEAESK